MRRAELEAKVSAMKRGEVLTKDSGRGLPSEELRLCRLEDIQEDSMAAALRGNLRILLSISSNCVGIVRIIPNLNISMLRNSEHS